MGTARTGPGGLRAESLHAAAEPQTSCGLNVFLQEGALLKLLSWSLETTGQKTRQILRQRTKTKSHQPFKWLSLLLHFCPRVFDPIRDDHVTDLPKLGTGAWQGWGNTRARTLTAP